MDGSPRISLCNYVGLLHTRTLLIFGRDEHKKRSPGCDFFALSKAKTTKTTKSKKSRTSKASRMSIQSTNTATVEDQSMADIAAEEGDSHLTAATDMTMASVATTATKAGRKVAKPKKGKTKALSKAAKAKLEEAAQASSFIEPEDDDFDVKVNAAPSMAAGGRKRDSAQMDIDQEDPDIFSPPLKRRATQARVSPVVPRAGLEPMEMDEEERDTHMADAEDLEDLSLRLPVPNSGKQGRRKQGSSVIRKASTTSKGPLRAAIPADVELDATLETELDRPLTDDETPVETKEEQPKARRATRTRKAAASTAPARKTTRGTMPIDGSAENHSPYMPGETQSMEIDSQDVEMVPAELAVLPKNGKKGSKSQKPSVSVKKGPEPNPVLDTTPIPHVEDAHEMPDNDVTVITKSPTILLPKSRQGKSRQPSRQVPSKAVAEDSASSQTADGEQADIAGSDAKKVGRKASATTKKGKVSKKAAAAAQPLEDVPDMPSQNEEKISVEDDHDMTVVHTEIVQPIQAEPEPLVVEQNVVEAVKPKAARGRPKGKAENSRVVSQEKSKATNSSIVEDEPGMLGFNPPRPSQPVPATKPSKLPPTPQPAKHGLSSPTPSPQSSDAENQPPSSRPSQTRPPLVDASPSRHQTVRVPLASTPVGSPSTRNFASRLQTTYGWSSIDVDGIFTGSPAPGKQSGVLATGDLSSPEKKMTVEEWIRHNARTGEEKLRNECERIVGRFESEGVRALKVLEGIVCAE
jgi:hypothetical protein